MSAQSNALLGQRICQPVHGAIHFAMFTSHRAGSEQGELCRAHFTTSQARHEDARACPDFADIHATNGTFTSKDAPGRCQVRRVAHDIPSTRG